MKLLLLFSTFYICFSFAEKVVVEDKAFARQSTDVLFYSEAKELLSKWDLVDCIFGGTEFYQRYKTNKQKVRAHLQINKYLKDREFEINKSDFYDLINKLKLKKCNVVSPLKSKIITSGIRIEVFLQEIALGTNKKSSKKALATLQKIFDVKYPVFFYDR